MNRHLSSIQISESLLGECSPDCQRHMETCPECRGEVARLQSALSDFRGSMHQWSSDQMPARLPIREWGLARVWAWTGIGRIGWVSAVVVAGLMVALWMPSNRVVPPRGAEGAAVDAALLSQVAADLSQPVPRPMEPLMNLVSFYSASPVDPQ